MSLFKPAGDQTVKVGLAFASSIVGAVAEGRGVYAVQDSVIILDAFLLSTGFNSLAKVGAARQRPAFHFGRQAATEAENHDDEEFLSFYSGDTTWAFALASSGATLAWLRGYRHAGIATGILGAFALTGGILRMCAGNEGNSVPVVSEVESRGESTREEGHTAEQERSLYFGSKHILVSQGCSMRTELAPQGASPS